MRNDDLVLGSDIETFYSSLKLNVYMPKGIALEKIVNYVDPIRKKSVRAEFREVRPFKIGTVRYTSTDRLHRKIILIWLHLIYNHQIFWLEERQFWG